MEKYLILALYQNGDVVNLNKAGIFPSSEVIAFVRCQYDSSSSSGKNEYWSYSIFDMHFNPVEKNTFQWNGFKCSIANKDEWLQPLKTWSGSHHYQSRIKVSISKGISQRTTVYLNHSCHSGEAFKALSKILSDATDKSLTIAKKEFIEMSRQESGI